MFKIENTNNGVKAVLTGFNTQELSTKIDECKNGECSCSCDPEIMNKISNIEVGSEDDTTSITITGNIDKEELEPMMKECLL